VDPTISRSYEFSAPPLYSSGAADFAALPAEGRVALL